MVGALKGITVLDLSRVLAGPLCTMMLADLGAEVVKVERPGEGDETREWGPPWAGDESAYYLSLNRNKRGITVDLKTEEGREVVRRLAAKADILEWLAVFRREKIPGGPINNEVMAELGYGADEVHSLRQQGIV